MSLNIIPKPAQDRVLKDSSDYCNDIENDNDKIPLDEKGRLISGGFNFSFNNRDKQCREMDALLSQNKNAKAKPLQHLVFAYGAKRPTHKQIRKHIQQYLKNLGMSDHMCLYDAHDNTGHFHVHILLCRLNHEPDETGAYRIADNSLFKTQNDKGVLRTNEAICRQATIAQICRDEGWESPGGLKYDEKGKPIPHKTKGKSKGFNGIPSKSDQLAAIGWDIFSTSADRLEPAERLADMGIKIQLVQKAGKIVGARLVSKDATCSFSSMNPNEKRLYQKLSQKFALAPIDKHPVPANVTPFHAEDHLRALMREVFQEPARFGASWDHLIGAVESHGAKLERSGGGLIVVRDNIKITTSSINNKFGFSKLEKLLGPCPLPKATPPLPSARDLLRQDAEAILSKHVRQGHGLYWMDIDLSHANISIQKKPFINNVGKPQNYWAVVRGDVSIPLSAISKTSDGNPVYTMWMLERLDACDPTVQKSKRIAQQKMQFEEIQKRCAVGGDLYQKYIADEYHYKKGKIEKMTFFGAIAKFFKLKKLENENVYKDRSINDQERCDNRNTPHHKQMFSM